MHEQPCSKALPVTSSRTLFFDKEKDTVDITHEIIKLIKDLMNEIDVLRDEVRAGSRYTRCESFVLNKMDS